MAVLPQEEGPIGPPHTRDMVIMPSAVLGEFGHSSPTDLDPINAELDKAVRLEVVEVWRELRIAPRRPPSGESYSGSRSF